MRSLRRHIEQWVQASGSRLDDIQGWEPFDENKTKMHELSFIKDNLGRFAEHIAGKEFFLAVPSNGRSFYLGDNPVSLHNMTGIESRGNLGLAVLEIEIYMPLASNLMLIAFCPRAIG